MSSILVMNAVRNMLRSHLGVPDHQCRVVDNPGNAPPDAGPVFIGVHPGRWRRWGGWRQGPTLDEENGCRVTVTVKAGAIQPQLYGELILQRGCAIGSCGVGIESLCREIAVYLHGNEKLLCALNTGVGGKQFTGGLFWADGGEAVDRGAAWWRCPSSKADPSIGMSQTVQFDGLRRTQETGEAT